MFPKHARMQQVTRIRKAGQSGKLGGELGWRVSTWIERTQHVILVMSCLLHVGITPINGFSIAHYAGVVTYNAKDFLSKNADFTHPDIVQLFSTAKVSYPFFVRRRHTACAQLEHSRSAVCMLMSRGALLLQNTVVAKLVLESDDSKGTIALLLLCGNGVQSVLARTRHRVP